MLAPIVCIVYNRANHTQRIIEALQNNTLAPESDLYIFSDAPKNDSANKEVKAVREYIAQVSGFKSVNIIESPYNMGCSASICNAVSRIISQHGKVIVIEDDVLTAPSFLQYMNDALELYKTNPNIWSIAGYNAVNIPANYKQDVFLAPRFGSWGWAMWSDRWNMIDWNKEGYEEIFNNPKTKKSFCKAGEDVYNTLRKFPDIWDNTTYYTQWRLGKYTVYPLHSLVKNIGIDGSGTHFTSIQKKYDVEAQNYNVELVQDIQPNEEIISRMRKFYSKKWYRKFLIFIAQKTGVYNRLLKRFA